MWKLNQPGSEIDETPHTSSDPCTVPSAASERKSTTETIDTRRKRLLHLTPIPPCVTAKESRICHLSAEMKTNLRHSEKTDDQRFSPVETPTESFKSDAAKRSSDNSFDDDSSQPGQFQKRQIYRMRATDAEPYPAESHTMSSMPRDEKNMYGEEIYQKKKKTLQAVQINQAINSPKQTLDTIHSTNQAIYPNKLVAIHPASTFNAKIHCIKFNAVTERAPAVKPSFRP